MGGPGIEELLLVEDNPDDARYLERLLHEHAEQDEQTISVGEITRARNLRTAVERLESDPDVVLLDLGLPDSNGLETVETVTDHAPHIPVVVITGRQESGLGREAISLGAEDYLEKGRITGELLSRTIRYSIDRHRKQREITELNHRLSLLHQIVRDEIRYDMQMVIGRGDELHEASSSADRQVTESLLDAARHTLSLTDRVRELTTVLSEGTEPSLEPIDLGAVVEEQTRRLVDRHDVSVTVHDETGSGPTVEAIPLLGSAVEQLLSNAVRHNDADRPEVVVRIETDRERPETVSLVIEDNGIGMPSVQRERLNDPATRYPEQAGIGTGLYLVLTVVELVDGSIEFTDNQSGGTTVRMTLDRPSAPS